MPNTPTLDLEKPAQGTTSWHTPLNSNMDKIDAHAAADISTAHPGTIDTADVADGAITAAKLSFDPATQAELDAHAAAANPHPTYLTQAEGDGLYEALGAVATHAGLADPHPTYLTQTEGDARYGQLAAANTWTLAQRIALAADGRGYEVKRVSGQTKNLLTFLKDGAEDGAETGIGSAVLARVDYQGGAGLQGLHVAPGANSSGYSGTFGIWIQPSIDVTQLLIDQVSGQTLPAMRVRRVDATKAFEMFGDTASGSLGTLIGYANDGANGCVVLAAGDNGFANFRAHFKSVVAGVTPLVAQGLAVGTQTADVVIVRAGTTILSRFDKSGYFMTRKIAAPADGDVATSEMALWFDNTNGAGKLMVKAKTANGTVVTGSLALT